MDQREEQGELSSLERRERGRWANTRWAYGWRRAEA
jgi:hypothetical protein